MPPPWLVAGPFPPEFHTDERCFITEHLNLPESPEASLALARVAPGVTTRLHSVEGTVERYIVLRGAGLVEVDGVQAAVGPGDRVLIPAGALQRITNLGTGDLEFYCLCTPRFRPEAYRDHSGSDSGQTEISAASRSI
jgi:mannose-6-phosphate isomerase-like protein (cupin superfamily)